ncbi:protein tyrosine phosphatase [Saccharothrix sp. CB00851]|nr:protein tyrosine phosphatase [Saccharothrix sp. CB00851]
MHLSFVGRDNVCRSPMAALVMREQLRRNALADRVRVSTAGTEPWRVGQPADRRAVRVLAEHGYPTGHLATRIGLPQSSADLVLLLDATPPPALLRLIGSADRVRPLRCFDPTAGDDLDVPDPYHRGPEAFREVLDIIEATVPGLLHWVRDHLPAAEDGAQRQP